VKPIPWHQVVLYFADGSSLISRWDAADARAIEIADGVTQASEEITAEHLRALAEIRSSNSCANWFTNEQLNEDGPHREHIDWSGFPASVNRSA
jgi:hypothetical protein